MNRILSGKIRLDIQQISLGLVLEEAVESIKPTVQAKEIGLKVTVDPETPPVSGDAGRLQQVFWNLLTNAIKFTPRRGEIEVRLRPVNSEVEVRVTDTGIGIAPEFLPHVFERFRQADGSTTRQHAGLGLGLAIVKNLVELHGGSVRVESGGLGKGSTFIIVLPVSAMESAEVEHPGALVRAEDFGFSPHADLAGINVLVVDDEPDARGLISRVLSRSNARIVSAGSAADALAILEHGTFDLIVSDIGMPGTDGYALIRAIRTLPDKRVANIPAIALTAYTRTEDRMKAIAAGFQNHIAKPAGSAELLLIAASLTGRSMTAGGTRPG